MPGYDESKDKLVCTIGRQKALAKEGKVHLVARVYSYNNGEPKLAIQRIRIKKDGDESMLRMGRLSRDEAEWVAKAIKAWVSRPPEAAPAPSEPHKVSEPRKPGVKPTKARRVRKKRPVKKVK